MIPFTANPCYRRIFSSLRCVLSANAKLDAAARSTAQIGAQNNLRKFYASGASPETIQKKFAAVAAWAKQHGLSPHQVFIGGFGVVRKEPDMPGARCEDRTRWLSDVRTAADNLGFSWSYFSYTGEFALVLTDSDRRLNQPVLASLGLKHAASGCGR